MTYLLLAVSFALVLGGAVLFTNAVEWMGKRMGLEESATGSILAAVSTALPESIIPIIAIIGGTAESENIAIGSIIGAPFMLGTIAMMLVGIASFAYRGRRQQNEEIAAHRTTVQIDLIYFAIFLGTALVLGIIGNRTLNVVAGIVFVLGYVSYTVLTVKKAGSASGEEEPKPLKFDRSKQDPPSNLALIGQFLVALGAIVGGAHLFVEELTAVAEELHIDTLVLALVIAPLASELPEKLNSFIWVREGKDDLALGNITGAMVFQSMIPVSIGLFFTEWKLEPQALVACGVAIAGGLLAMWTLLARKRISLPAITTYGAGFLGFVAFVILTA